MAKITKNLTVTCEPKKFTDPATKEEKEYTQLCIVVDGLPIVVRPVDKTGRAIINKHFGL